LGETKTQEAEDADQADKVCNKIESFKADFHQRWMCDEIFTSALTQATTHPTEGLLGDEYNQKRQESFASKKKSTKSHALAFTRAWRKFMKRRGYAQTCLWKMCYVILRTEIIILLWYN
jgi:phage-related protein